MIVSLRGVNASGKSYIVRAVMAKYAIVEEVRVTGRRHPVGYKLAAPDKRPVFVPGHYPSDDTVLGGCDTLLDTDEVYGQIWKAYDAGFSVLYEGRVVSLGTCISSLFDSQQCEIVVIDHPLSRCIEAIKERGGRITVEGIRRFERKIAEGCSKLEEEGYLVHRLDRAAAMEKCLSLIA